MNPQATQLGDALAAALHLSIAVRRLTATTDQDLDRYPPTDPAVRAAAAEAEAAHTERAAPLHRAYAAALARHDQPTATRALSALIELTRRHRTQQRARVVDQATMPSLLDALVDAAESRRGDAAGRAGVQRSPTNLRACALLGRIERTVGHRGLRHHVDRVEAWSVAVVHLDRPNLPGHAATAHRWAAEATEIVTPDRTFDLAARCPVCRARWCWVVDDGERVQRAALQVHYSTRSASCAACGTTWGPGHLDHLARVLQTPTTAHPNRKGPTTP